MSVNKAVLIPETFYHIFNQGVGHEKLFLSPENYVYFLGLFRKYIFPVAKIFCYSLVPDRLDFLILVRDREAIWQQMNTLNYRHINIPDIEHFFLLQQFSNLFNAYTKAFNKQQCRKGRLFIEPFSRKPLGASDKFTRIIQSMHTIPVHKGLCNQPEEWPFTSFTLIKQKKENWVETETVLNWFGSLSDFVSMHEQHRFQKNQPYSHSLGYFSGY